MPNPPTHIDLALMAAERVGDPRLSSHIGHFVLGSTSPDIRSIVRWPRQEYHFAPLDFDRIGAGVRGLFRLHPQLVRWSTGDGPTGCFVAGYITHILLDEAWIAEIYRPYFANPDVFADGVLGGVMDRAIQLELDRQAGDAWGDSIGVLEAATEPVDVGFIPADALERWRAWMVELLGRGFSWDRLRFMARRMAAGDDAHPAHALAGRFLEDMPDSLDRVLERISRRELSEFKERSVERLAVALEEYLS